MRSLQLTEATDRRALLELVGYDVDLDLASGDETFPSRTQITFRSGAGHTFLDLKCRRLDEITLDGDRLDPTLLDDGRFPLRLTQGEHRLEVTALMAYRNDGEGLHRSTDPVDGRDYVYAMCFMDAAPSVFACFDQPDLKAPYTLHVSAPRDWVVLGNAAGVEVDQGRWEFEPTAPLATYFVTVVGGPWHVVAHTHDEIPLRFTARRSLAEALDAEADELITVTTQSFDELHRLFGLRYPFGKYDQAFVPEFNAAAMENPGCITIRDPYVFSEKVTRSERIKRATTLAHEMAHQWFGNLVTPVWWDDLWLNESFAEYLGNRVTVEATEFTDALRQRSLTRKNWGLVADSRPTTHPVAGNGAVDATAALQDFDGISYAKGESVLRQLAATVGDEVFFGGARDLFAQRRFGNATMHDLFACWEAAGAGDLGEWSDAWLRTAGLDRIRLDRSAGELVLTPPEGAGTDREHRFEAVTWDGSAWSAQPVVVSGRRTPISVGDAPVLLDSSDESWADLTIDETSLQALPGLVDTLDATQRTTLWVTVRNGVHQASLDPRQALDLVCAGLAHESADAAVTSVTTWARSHLFAVVPQRAIARARLHHALTVAGQHAEPGSALQLAAFRGVVATADSADELDQALAGATPPGVVLDRDLRWRLLKRLTLVGSVDRSRLADELAADPSAPAQLDHAWCLAALADEEAKAWAWARFTGAENASNYELLAIGEGMWQPGQEELLRPYVARYFEQVAATAAVRRGWSLADSAEAFFPLMFLEEPVVTATERLCADADLDPSLRRRLVNCGDEVRRRIGVRRAYGVD